MKTAVDFAARLIPAHAIKAAGHIAVMAYISPSRPGSNFGAKPISKAYADELKAAGLEVVSIWQYGKPGNTQAPSDWTTGYEGGLRMAQEANRRHLEAGGPPEAPIYFAVDEDVTLYQWNDTAVDFFKGLTDELGPDRVGIYGHARVLDWAREDGVASWFWQTRAWSRNVVLDWAHVYQRVIDTPSNPGPLIDGSSVDVNDLFQDTYGQWSAFTQTGPAPVVNKPAFNEVDRLGPSHSSRNGARISHFLLHTQEGNGTAESLAGYLNNPNNGVSYHYTLRDSQLVRVVPEERSSWSVLDWNPRAVNLCFAGSRAGWSREQWLAIEHDLRIAAYVAVRSAKAHGYSTDVIARGAYRRADGISDHGYVTWLGIGNHTDVGPNFPWDVFSRFVFEYANPGPPPNAINDYAKANPWLGARMHADEIHTPDGQGRLVGFLNGTVYWHPSVGAHGIPVELFTKYAEQGWETGALGYPIGDHTKLAGGGFVQGFQGGAIYRKNTSVPAYIMRGAIRDRWNRSGFENGPLGYPVDDERIKLGGVVLQDFEHGQIVWHPANATFALLDANGRDILLEDK